MFVRSIIILTLNLKWVTIKDLRHYVLKIGYIL